jgi:hypothetical protein
MKIEVEVREGVCYKVLYRKCRKNPDGTLTCAKKGKVLRWTVEEQCDSCGTCEQ